MNGSAETRDDDRGHIFQRQRSFPLFRAAGQLPIAAGERTTWGIDVDDMVRQNSQRIAKVGFPISFAGINSSPALCNEANKTFIL